MKKERWKVLKFCFVLGAKSTPRFFLAPYVGAIRGVIAEYWRIDREITAFEARLLKEQEVSTADANYPRSHA
jgi:hypothetical protein